MMMMGCSFPLGLHLRLLLETQILLPYCHFPRDVADKRRIIIIITMTIFIVLSAICESSLWFLWAKVGQRQVAANS